MRTAALFVHCLMLAQERAMFDSSIAAVDSLISACVNLVPALGK